MILLPIIICASCKDDDESLSDEEVQFQALLGTWEVVEEGAVTRDNIKSNQWLGFSITIGENRYTTTNTYPEVWPTEGVWSFVEGNFNKIQRADGTIIDIEVNETTLIMSFVKKEGNPQNRGETGNYMFKLTKQ